MSDHDGIHDIRTRYGHGMPSPRPTRDELPDELDAPAPAPTVRDGGWTIRMVECRAGCGNLVRPSRGMCDDCLDLYNAQR